MSNQNQSTGGDAYIYSTLSNDQLYTTYMQPHKNGPHIPQKQVLVNGKANVISKNFVTPKGVVTKVSAEQLKLLEADCDFQRHKEAGYIKIEKRSESAEVVAKDMKPKDQSAQLSGEDYKGNKSPKVNAKK